MSNVLDRGLPCSTANVSVMEPFNVMRNRAQCVPMTKSNQMANVFNVADQALISREAFNDSN